MLYRSFKDGVLSDISIWEIAGALNNAIEEKNIQRTQINLIIKDDIKKKKLDKQRKQPKQFSLCGDN